MSSVVEVCVYPSVLMLFVEFSALESMELWHYINQSISISDRKHIRPVIFPPSAVHRWPRIILS